MSPHTRKSGGVRPAIPAGLLARFTFALTALAPMVHTCVANAEIPITAQALADGGAFEPYAPVPVRRTGLCLVDTGVNLNPDTESSIVSRFAIDGGSGDDVSPVSHGTIMAMMAAAPPNGWGMVGVAPGAIQIVSVRIAEPGETTFPFGSYAAGITACLRVRQLYDVRVINLSLGSPVQPTSENYEALGNAVQRATGYGIAVVAAAGNDDQGAIGYPAAYPGVISVGASDTQTGSFCAFSNRGEGLRMLAPGCDLDGADPITGTADYNYWQGTSEASALDAAALTALFSYRPDLSSQTAEKDLTSADKGMLNIAQSFRDAGLEQVVVAGETAEPKHISPAQSTNSPSTPFQSATPSPASTPPSTILTRAFPPPSLVTLRRKRGRLNLVLTRCPEEAELRLRYMGYRSRAHHLSTLRTLTGTFTTVTLPTWVVEIFAQCIDPYDARRASPPTIIAVPQGHTRSFTVRNYK